jgi:hypothetical protein|tara:strand:- start:534 stop:1091 length:558 start_codon:yes stop_codon:yes gene_type:complete
MKLNLGCGFNKREDYINVDCNEYCMPDIEVDLDKTEWPWGDDSVDAVDLTHTLEHLGETTAEFFHVMKELYRVCKSGTVIDIAVPHPMHHAFMDDPTHVRPITPDCLDMFNKKHNSDDIKAGGYESKLGIMLGIDLRIAGVKYLLEPKWELLVQNNLMSDVEMVQKMTTENNVCMEMLIKLEVVK